LVIEDNVKQRIINIDENISAIGKVAIERMQEVGQFGVEQLGQVVGPLCTLFLYSTTHCSLKWQTPNWRCTEYCDPPCT